MDARESKKNTQVYYPDLSLPRALSVIAVNILVVLIRILFFSYYHSRFTFHVSPLLPLHTCYRFDPRHFSREARMVRRFDHLDHVFVRLRRLFRDP